MPQGGFHHEHYLDRFILQERKMQTDRKLGACLKAIFIIAIFISGGPFIALTGLGETFGAVTDSPGGVKGSTGLDTITIENRGNKKDQERRFDHKTHTRDHKIPCWQCHDRYMKNKMSWKPWGGAKTCNQCHKEGNY